MIFALVYLAFDSLSSILFCGRLNEITKKLIAILSLGGRNLGPCRSLGLYSICFWVYWFVDSMSEKLLEAMDGEIGRLSGNLLGRQGVMDALGKWQELWKEKLALEESEQDPHRYTNRAGNLDKELKVCFSPHSALAQSCSLTASAPFD